MPVSLLSQKGGGEKDGTLGREAFRWEASLGNPGPYLQGVRQQKTTGERGGMVRTLSAGYNGHTCGPSPSGSWPKLPGHRR